MLRMKEMNISADEMEMFTIGEIVDMVVEHGNDYEEWDTRATQEDIDRLMR